MALLASASKCQH